MKKLKIDSVKTIGFTTPSLIGLAIFFYHFDEKNQKKLNQRIDRQGFFNYDLLTTILNEENLGVDKKTFSNNEGLSEKSVLKIANALSKIAKEKIKIHSNDELTSNLFSSLNFEISFDQLYSNLDHIIELTNHLLTDNNINEACLYETEKLLDSLNLKEFIPDIKYIALENKIFLMTAHIELKILLLLLNTFDYKLIRTKDFLEKKLEIEKKAFEASMFSKKTEKYINDYQIKELEEENLENQISIFLPFLFELMANLEADYMDESINSITKENKEYLAKEWGKEALEVFEKNLYSLAEKPPHLIHHIFSFSQEHSFKRTVYFIVKYNQLNYENTNYDSQSKKFIPISIEDSTSFIAKYLPIEDKNENGDGGDIETQRRELMRYFSGETIIKNKRLELFIKEIASDNYGINFIAAKLSIKADVLHKKFKENGYSEQEMKAIFNQYPKIYQKIIEESPIKIIV